MTRNAGSRENGLPRKIKPKTKERTPDGFGSFNEKEMKVKCQQSLTLFAESRIEKIACVFSLNQEIPYYFFYYLCSPFSSYSHHALMSGALFWSTVSNSFLRT